MIFELNEQQRMIRDMARDFAAREIAPIAAEIDEEERFPFEVVKKMGELGFMGMNVPEEFGGSALDSVCYVLAMEEVSKACASCGVIMSVNNSLVCWPLEAYATDEQKKKWLTPLASGQKLGAYCLSEPGAGTDAAAQSTTAKQDGDHWVINGMKNFITNGANADVLLVFAQTNPELKHKGIRAFIVENTADGFSVIRKEEKMGIRASDTAQLAFDNVRVPNDQVLGGEGTGFKIAMSTLDGGRIGIASQALGISAAAYEAALAYSKEREQFGRPIAKFQAIQWKIADMATRLEAARLLTYRAAWTKDQGSRYSEEAAMAKLYASEASHFITNEAVQVFGGNGYSKEFPVERHFRDAKITEIYEGTSEAQRMVISSMELKK
ncbi:MAG: acyl-CoA dehydrogenase [Candidatus Krumholzibacteria bacterium]|nr:acyl-CoA dehydrogenase [Candidatus Krumholzibacteria bacterium]